MINRQSFRNSVQVAARVVGVGFLLVGGVFAFLGIKNTKFAAPIKFDNVQDSVIMAAAGIVVAVLGVLLIVAKKNPLRGGKDSGKGDGSTH
jgi:hypothetical protein